MLAAVSPTRTENKPSVKVARSYDRSILKCLVAAKLAGRDVDFKEAVCYMSHFQYP